MDRKRYEPNGLLSRLVGERMYSVEFVLNDYVQFRFDGSPGAGDPVTLNCYVWPLIEFDGRTWSEKDAGYADVLRRLTPGTVVSTTEQTGSGVRLALDTGALVIHPTLDEIHVEIAEISGFKDGAWMVWHPGEESFEDLA
ncbi:hypothetical protein FQ142_11790 [Microbacterium sp. ANT_H45B]|uniref:hypothetical protein n=1 Tax=Microbacterium sp. ANT_H45B TaxID=2597346 RepID=UPI0011F051C5|nr:hypothetical protein [Microbacterium sp. ANT_H45B]KAA0961488.1 hypothetical protein FQ142_11790 [Microbacterium sp. ANT_H45B]